MSNVLNTQLNPLMLASKLNELQHEIERKGYPSQMAIHLAQNALQEYEHALPVVEEVSQAPIASDDKRNARIVSTGEMGSSDEINISQISSMLKRTADGEDILRKILLQKVLPKDKQTDGNISIRKLAKSKLITLLTIEICGKNQDYYVLSDKGGKVFSDPNIKKLKKNFQKLVMPQWIENDIAGNATEDDALIQAAIIKDYFGCTSQAEQMEYITFFFPGSDLLFACQIGQANSATYYCAVVKDDNNHTEEAFIKDLIGSEQVEELVMISLDDDFHLDCQGLNIVTNKTTSGLNEIRMRK